MEPMETASMKALAAAPNAAAACLLHQRVPRGPPEVCLARGGRLTNLSGPNDGHTDPLLFELMREPGAETRAHPVQIWA